MPGADTYCAVALVARVDGPPVAVGFRDVRGFVRGCVIECSNLGTGELLIGEVPHQIISYRWLEKPIGSDQIPQTRRSMIEYLMKRTGCPDPDLVSSPA